jgi:hypothetical protein
VRSSENRSSALTCKLLTPSDDDPCDDLDPRCNFSTLVDGLSRPNWFRPLFGSSEAEEFDADEGTKREPSTGLRSFRCCLTSSLCLRSKFLIESVELWPEFDAEDSEARGMCHGLYPEKSIYE